MPIGLQALEEHALTDQNHAGFLFNLIRNPRGYQYIGTSPLPDSFHFAHHTRIQNINVTERHRHHPQNFGVGHAFFLLFHPRNSKLKKIRSQIGPQQLHGSANSSIELLSTTIFNQLDECLSYSCVSHRFSKKRKPSQKIFPIPRKPRILKKNLNRYNYNY